MQNMDKDFVKFAIKDCALLTFNAIGAGIMYTYAKKFEKEGKTLNSGILKGTATVSSVMAWIAATRLKSAVSFPNVVIVENLK